MRTRTALVPLAAIALACAGCGSSNKAATTTSTGSATTTSTGSAATSRARAGDTASIHLNSFSYYVKLAPHSLAPPGVKLPGIPTGSGVALISVVAPSNELCWTFPPLKNITTQTESRINGRLKFGITSTPLGPYKASGCRLEPRILLSLFEKHRHSFYLLIANPQFPGSGVRGQL
jgi:hypothetical protein